MKMDLGHLLVILTLLCTGLQGAAASEWGYWGKNGPESWPGICTTGKKQSPIDIVTKDAIEILNISSLDFFYQDNLTIPATLDNNGHSVGVKLHGTPVYMGSKKKIKRLMLWSKCTFTGALSILWTVYVTL
jgi:carbonic anhydrase